MENSRRFKIGNDKVVLVIGNGFDLHFGLKTSYKNFMQSVNFQELIYNKNSLAIYLKNESERNESNNFQNWIDVENELKNYSNAKSGVSKNLLLEFKDLKKSLVEYLKGIELKNIDKQLVGYKLIESLEDSSVLVLNFNYTNTLEIILECLSQNGIKIDIKHIKIHGSTEKNDIIFGVEDSASIKSEHVFLKKSVNKNFNTTNFNEFISGSNRIIFFGYSLGVTDHSYFKNLFSNLMNTEKHPFLKGMIVYHHGEANYFKTYTQIDTLTLKQISKFRGKVEIEFIDTMNKI